MTKCMLGGRIAERARGLPPAFFVFVFLFFFVFFVFVYLFKKKKIYGRMKDVIIKLNKNPR